MEKIILRLLKRPFIREYSPFHHEPRCRRSFLYFHTFQTHFLELFLQGSFITWDFLLEVRVLCLVHVIIFVFHEECHVWLTFRLLCFIFYPLIMISIKIFNTYTIKRRPKRCLPWAFLGLDVIFWATKLGFTPHIYIRLGWFIFVNNFAMEWARHDFVNFGSIRTRKRKWWQKIFEFFFLNFTGYCDHSLSQRWILILLWPKVKINFKKNCTSS